jgi:pimeloyl-ACP methyl ester carboxylesterase
MKDFERNVYAINGVDTVVYSAGQGEPLLFLHGAGTFHGAEFARAWTKHFRVLLPWHPGYAESADAPGIEDMHDYVVHYSDLLDTLGVDKVHLVGFSLGGWMAARLAIEQRHRVERLVLVAPAGMFDRQIGLVDVLGLPGEQLPAMLVSNFDVIKPYLPTGPDMDFGIARYREAASTARLMWEKPWDPKLKRHLYRVNAPTLIVWGDQDRIVPPQYAEVWRHAIPHAEVQMFKGVGHLVLDEDPKAPEAVAAFLSAPAAAKKSAA